MEIENSINLIFKNENERRTQATYSSRRETRVDFDCFSTTIVQIVQIPAKNHRLKLEGWKMKEISILDLIEGSI